LRIEITIYTHDRDLLLGPSEKHVRLDDQVEVRYEGIVLQEAEGSPQAFIWVVQVASAVGSGILASWIYDKLKGKSVDKVVVERTVVELDEGEIRRVIQEKITKG